MRITERRLRSLIRGVIRESYEESGSCEGRLDPVTFLSKLENNEIRPRGQAIKCDDLPVGWKRVSVDILGLIEGSDFLIRGDEVVIKAPAGESLNTDAAFYFLEELADAIEDGSGHMSAQDFFEKEHSVSY